MRRLLLTILCILALPLAAMAQTTCTLPVNPTATDNSNYAFCQMQQAVNAAVANGTLPASAATLVNNAQVYNMNDPALITALQAALPNNTIPEIQYIINNATNAGAEFIPGTNIEIYSPTTVDSLSIADQEAMDAHEFVHDLQSNDPQALGGNVPAIGTVDNEIQADAVAAAIVGPQAVVDMLSDLAAANPATNVLGANDSHTTDYERAEALQAEYPDANVDISNVPPPTTNITVNGDDNVVLYNNQGVQIGTQTQTQNADGSLLTTSLNNQGQTTQTVLANVTPGSGGTLITTDFNPGTGATTQQTVQTFDPNLAVTGTVTTATQSYTDGATSEVTTTTTTPGPNGSTTINDTTYTDGGAPPVGGSSITGSVSEVITGAVAYDGTTNKSDTDYYPDGSVMDITSRTAGPAGSNGSATQTEYEYTDGGAPGSYGSLTEMTTSTVDANGVTIGNDTKYYDDGATQEVENVNGTSGTDTTYADSGNPNVLGNVTETKTLIVSPNDAGDSIVNSDTTYTYNGSQLTGSTTTNYDDTGQNVTGSTTTTYTYYDGGSSSSTAVTTTPGSPNTTTVLTNLNADGSTYDTVTSTSVTVPNPNGVGTTTTTTSTVDGGAVSGMQQVTTVNTVPNADGNGTTTTTTTTTTGDPLEFSNNVTTTSISVTYTDSDGNAVTMDEAANGDILSVSTDITNNDGTSSTVEQIYDSGTCHGPDTSGCTPSITDTTDYDEDGNKIDDTEIDADGYETTTYFDPDTGEKTGLSETIDGNWECVWGSCEDDTDPTDPTPPGTDPSCDPTDPSCNSATGPTAATGTSTASGDADYASGKAKPAATLLSSLKLPTIAPVTTPSPAADAAAAPQGTAMASAAPAATAASTEATLPASYDTTDSSTSATAAGTSSGIKVVTPFCNIKAAMSGTTGKALASVAIIILGLGALVGKISWKLSFSVVTGIALIIGAGSVIGAMAGSFQCPTATAFAPPPDAPVTVAADNPDYSG